MKIAVYSIQQTLFSGEAEKLICHTPQGQITVLDQHIPLISSLVGPRLEIVGRNGKINEIPFKGGFLEVRPASEVVILASDE